jgi:hypothetical protein
MTPIHGTRSRAYFETAMAFAWLIIEIAYLLIAMVGFVVVVAMLYQTVAYGQTILDSGTGPPGSTVTIAVHLTDAVKGTG